MLGSLTEAEDAVQEAWLHVSRADTGDVANLRGWLTTVVGRVCLDMLRSRRSRPEEPVGRLPEPIIDDADGIDPEHQALLADSVGLALLVAVLDPDVLLRAEVGAGPLIQFRGASRAAEQAMSFAGRAGFARPALVNGAAGLVAARGGRLIAVLGFTVVHGRIVEIDILADPTRLNPKP